MKRPALGHLLGYTALIVILTAGAAQSLSGSNTVFSDDIVDGAIYNPDIHDRAVTGAKVANDSLTGSDINEAAIPGFKKVFTTRIRANGTEQSGDATSAASAGSTGVYNVTFGFNVAPCSPHVTSTDFFDHGSVTTGTWANTLIGNVTDTNVIQVQLWRVASGAATPVAGSFVLTLVCT